MHGERASFRGAPIDRFKPRYRDVAIDLRGCGGSSKLPAEVKSVTDL